jgi:HK97 family phage portal protein
MSNVLSTIRKAAKAAPTVTAPVDNRGGWFPFIREPYAGAWQNNDGWTVSNVLAYPIVFACITLICDDIGKLPAYSMRETQDDIWVRMKDKRLDALLRKPNGYQNHIQFKQWWMSSKLVRGNTYVLKNRDATGRVIGLYVLHPDYVQPLVAPNGDVYYQLGQDWLNKQELASVTVPASEIIHDRMNCLFHPLVGISPLFAGGLAASAGLKINADASKFFENGARPSGILTAPGEISQTTADRLKDHWHTAYTGPNAGKVAVLGDSLKFEPLRMNFVDAEVIKILEWSDHAICSVFKVPPYKVGVGPAPAHNNIEALQQEYYGECLQIHIESMELLLDEALEMRDRTGVELDLDVLFRMDGATLIKMLGEGVKAAIYAPDEARKRVNLPPVAGGKTPYLQQQNYSLEALAKRDAQADPFATGGGAPAPAEPVPDDADDQDAKAFVLDLAQQAALKGIVAAVMQREMPVGTAATVIRAAFPGIPMQAIDSLLAAIKEGLEATAPQDVSPAPAVPASTVADESANVLKLLPMFLREELRCDP